MSFFDALKAELLVESGKSIIGSIFGATAAGIAAGTTEAVKGTVAKRVAEIGGKKTFTDEKWYSYTTRSMDGRKLEIWEREIRPYLLKDFGDGYFSRLGYIDAATQIRLNIEAKAQEEIPTIKMEIKNDKGKVIKVVTRPVTNIKPLSTWCLENYVDMYLKITEEHVNNNGLKEDEAKQKALAELRIIMRESGFAVGQAPELYQKLDDFVAVVPNLLAKTLDGVKTVAKYSGIVTLWLSIKGIQQIKRVPEYAASAQQALADHNETIKARRPWGLGWLWAILGG